jgi:hypothetical protein
MQDTKQSFWIVFSFSFNRNLIEDLLGFDGFAEKPRKGLVYGRISFIPNKLIPFKATD